MLDIKKHRQVMFEIITDVYRHPLGDKLGFKGGTMAYFFYELDRFSIDLDFDLLDETKVKEMKEFISNTISRHGIIKKKLIKNLLYFGC